MKATLLAATLLCSASTLAAPYTEQGALACKPNPGDPLWPADDVWKKELPNVEKAPAPEGKSTRPDFTVTAKKPADVIAAVKFAAKYNVRLSIFNSGHDFHGRCEATSGLLLNVGNLRGCRVHESFTPTANGTAPVEYGKYCETSINVIKPVAGKQAAVTFGVGVNSQEITNALDKSGLFTIVAAATTVKPGGGFAQAGGHAPFSSKYGLAADNILEYKVVTADGRLVVANEKNNPDLFIALRGGGGGTFGVVLEATMNAFPTPKIAVAKWWLEAKDHKDTSSVFEPAAYMHSQFPGLNARGAQGYYYVYPWGLLGRLLMADTTAAQAKEIMSPMLAGFSVFPGMKTEIHQYQEFKSFKEWYDKLFGELPTPKPTRPMEIDRAVPRGVSPMDSWLLSAADLHSPKLAAAMKASMPTAANGMLRGHLVGGGKVNDPAADTYTTVNPAWRRAFVHLIATGGTTPNATAIKQIDPASGSYSNENGGSREPNWKKAMFGRHYDHLYQIKQKYDPKGLFWVSPGVGADDFGWIDGRLCLVKGTSSAQTSSSTAPPTDFKVLVASSPKAGYRPFPQSQKEADEKRGASMP